MLDSNMELAALEQLADRLVRGHQDLLDGLKAMRKKHRLSQQQVAERMGVSQPTVAAFERYDSNPTLSTIRRYALAVDARIDERVTDDCTQRELPALDDVVSPTRWAPSEHHRVDWKVTASL